MVNALNTFDVMLGQQLKTKVKDVMTTPAITLPADKVVSGTLPIMRTSVECFIYLTLN